MASDGDDAEVAAPSGEAKKSAPKKASAPVEATDDEPAAETDDDLDDVDLDDEDADDDELAAEAKADVDPDLAKRLAKVRKQEQRVREQHDAARRELETRQRAFVSEWKPKIEALEQFEKLKARRDVIGQLKALGYNEESFEDLSRIVYGHSPAAAAEPKNREAVRKLQSERELREQLAELKARDEARDKRDAEREAQATAAREADAYMGKVHKAVSESTPLVQKRLEARPENTRKALGEIAYRLAVKNGGAAVEPARVVKAYERKLERDRDLFGGGTEAKPAGKAAAKATSAAAAKKQAIEVVEAPASKRTSIIPSREDALAELEAFERGERTLD